MMNLIKEIKSKDGKLHFRRWQLIKTPWFSIYIHGIYAPDEDRHLHNHTWDYTSIVLSGSYLEKTKNHIKLLGIGKISSRDGSDYHKIYKLVSKSVYTLFIVGPTKRHWGYIVDDKHITHEEYRKLKNNKLL